MSQAADKKLTVRIDPRLFRATKTRAVRDGVRMSDIVADALREHLRTRPRVVAK